MSIEFDELGCFAVAYLRQIRAGDSGVASPIPSATERQSPKPPPNQNPTTGAKSG
jgi:hypothetical protein